MVKQFWGFLKRCNDLIWDHPGPSGNSIIGSTSMNVHIKYHIAEPWARLRVRNLT